MNQPAPNTESPAGAACWYATVADSTASAHTEFSFLIEQSAFGFMCKFEQHNPRALKLLELIEQLDTPFGFERSFRVSPAGLFADRYLVTVSRLADMDRTILDLCRELRMPAELLETVSDHRTDAKFWHFGFEQGAATCVYKVYLEFDAGIDPGQSGLQHLAFKWNPADCTQHVLTKYIRYRRLTVRDLLHRLEHVYEMKHSPALEIARDIMLLAASKITPAELHYMEVSEEGNPRRSFDINFYDAELLIRDARCLLLRTCELFSIPAERFEAHYASVAPMSLGHVAGGVHRNGEDFFSVYYGARARVGC